MTVLAAVPATARAQAAPVSPRTSTTGVGPAKRAPRPAAAPKAHPADAAFMAGMIHHHAQAITMSRLAPSHGATDAVQTLAARIINAQKDDIALMSQWLREHQLAVPDPLAPAAKGMAGMSHDMPGMSHDVMMPGMLTPAQMQALDAAKGPDFDRLFLSGMIQHHQGATAMVKELLSHDGAAQNREVFKLAADVNVDQTTEIERMRKMLANLMFERRAP